MEIPKSIYHRTNIARHQIGEQIFGKTVKDIYFDPTNVDIIFSDDSFVTFFVDSTDEKCPEAILQSIYWPEEKT